MEVIALAGFLGVVSIIACSILAYHAFYVQRELDQLREIVRGIGLRVGSPPSELPPARDLVDEYAPDAIIDDTASPLEWRLPRSLRDWDDA